MFEARTYDAILQEMLNAAPEGTDTRQGSIFYDFVAPCALMVSRYYNEVDIAIDLITIDSAEGEYLDSKAAEHGLTRNAAVATVRAAIFTGASVTSNLRFLCGGYYWVTKYNTSGTLVVEAEQSGEAPNMIASGTNLVPMTRITGLTAASIGDLITAGTEEETDDHLRERLREKISNPPENGNRQHYKTWCESIPGVGLARIDPLWNGPNTVRAILLASDGTPVTTSVVSAVQNYIDPGATGLGEGVANIGAYFTAVASQELSIEVAATVTLDGTTVDIATAEAVAALTSYFSSLSLACTGNGNVTIRVAAISNILFEIAGITDYMNVTINGGTGNITVAYTHVPVLGGVKLVEA